MADDREQKIRDRAYALWENAGGEHGRHEDHWSQAEQELGASAPTQPEPAEGGNGASETSSISAPTQQQPAEGGDDASERLEGSPENQK